MGPRSIQVQPAMSAAAAGACAAFKAVTLQACNHPSVCAISSQCMRKHSTSLGHPSIYRCSHSTAQILPRHGLHPRCSMMLCMQTRMLPRAFDHRPVAVPSMPWCSWQWGIRAADSSSRGFGSCVLHSVVFTRGVPQRQWQRMQLAVPRCPSSSVPVQASLLSRHGGPAAADDAAGLCAHAWVMKHTVPGLDIAESIILGVGQYGRNDHTAT